MTYQKLSPLLAALLVSFSAGMAPAIAQPEQVKRPRIGLALGGGGARGLAHVGVLRVLEQQKIPVDYICGTSMGAIVGGFYAAGMSLDEIDQLFRNKSLMHAYDTVPIPVRVALIPVFFIPHIFGYRPLDGLYKGNKFAAFCNEALPPDSRCIESSKIPFGAVGANLLDGKAYAITTGNVGRALQASSAIPSLRRPVPWQGKLFVDGGVINNIPVEQCRAMGADIVIAVDVDERLLETNVSTFHHIGSVPYRCVNMHLAKLDEPQLKQADLVIHPDVDGIDLLSHRQKDILRAERAGVDAASAALPDIKKVINGKLCNSPREGDL